VSFVIDANIILYAVNADSEHHHKAKAFVDACAGSSEQWCLPWPIVNAFVRISTHPSILPRPLTPAHAVAVIDQILELPHVSAAGEDDPDFWKLFRHDITTMHLRGNLITDASIIAIMRSHGVSTIYSKDRDLLRFSGIKVIDPLK
jgi:toxin-antitoxin system PIN domain toxin